jgi:hypothetical protein
MGDMRAATSALKAGFILPFYSCLLEELKTINRICRKVDTIKLLIQMYSAVKCTGIKV